MTVIEEDEAKHMHEDQEDPRIKKFTVTNPVKVAGHIKYTITGEDSEG